MKKLILLSLAVACILLVAPRPDAVAQAAQTIGAGNWDNPAIWSTGSVPNSSFAAITVRHAVLVRALYSPVGGGVLTVDQLTVTTSGTTGTLTIESGAELILANGAGVDLTLSGSGSLVVNGNLISRNTVTYGGTAITNTFFNSGSTYERQHSSVATANSLPTAAWNTNSLLLLTGLTNGTTATNMWKQDFGNVRINSPAIASGNVNFAGFLGSNGGAGAGRIKGFLDIVNTTVSGDGVIILNSTGTSTGTSAVNVDGALSVSGPSRIELTTSGTVEMNVGGGMSFASTLTGASASQCATTGSGTLTITSGNFSMTSGDWNFASGNGGVGSIVINGGNTTVSAGIIETSGNGAAAGNFTFTGNSSNLTLSPALLGGGTVNFNVNKNSGQSLSLLTDLTATGLALTSGKLILGGKTLTATGIISQSGGTIDATTPSPVFINGAGTAVLAFTAGSVLTTFEMNRATTLTTTSSFTVNQLHLYNGTVTVNSPGVMTMANTGAIELKAGALTNTPTAAGTYDVLYNNTTPLTSGGELPVSTTALFKLTKQGSSSVTLNAAITTLYINGDLTNSVGSFLGNGKNISLAGNFINDATLTLGGGQFSFTSAVPVTMTGAVSPTFTDLSVATTLSTAINFRVNGNLAVPSGSFTATGGIATFGGTTAVTNTGALNLSAVTILANSALTASSGTMGIAGNFIITNGTSTFTHNSGTVLFNGTTSMTGSGAKTFNNISVSGSLTCALSLAINGNIINNGTISFTAGTLTFGGSATMMTGTPTATGFFTTTISGGALVTSSIPFTTGGNLTVTGSLVANQGFSTTGTITVSSGGSLTGSNLPFSSTGNIAANGTMISNGGFSTSGNLTVSGTGAATANTAHYSVSGNIAVTSPGTFTANAGADGTLLGNISGSGNFLSNDSVTFGAVSSITGNGSRTFLHVNVTSGSTLTSNNDLTIKGNINNGGTINFTAGLLTLNGTTQSISGTPAATSFSDVTIASGTAVTSSIAFTTTGPLIITGSLTATAGFAAQTTMTVSTGGSLTTSNTPFTVTGNSTVNGPIVSGGGFTASGTFVITGGGKLTANTAPFTVAGNLTVTSPSTLTGNSGAIATIKGNVVATGAINIAALTIFSGTTAMSGAGSKIFNDVVILGTLTPNAAWSMTGALSLGGSGVLNAGNNRITFNGNCAFSNSGTGTATFNQLTVGAGHSLSATSNFTITGSSFIGNGSFTSTATTTFGRAGAVTISGTGAKSFGGIVVNSGTTLTPNAAYTITGNLGVTGILKAGNNTVTFGGTTIITITAPGTVTFNSLIIGSGHSLVAPVTTFTVNGNFTDNGAFNSNNGTVVFAGNLANRQLTGTSTTLFFNINISNGTQATDLFVESNKDLLGVLTMAANARMDPDGAGNAGVFRLRSIFDNPSIDASIAALSNPTLSPPQINGKITVQRYMSPEGRIYRYISTPVVGATVASWQDNFPITGTFSNPSNPGTMCGKAVKSNSPSLYYYSEATGAYVAYPTSGLASANPLTVGRGYAAFIRECTNPTVIDVTGTMSNTVNMGNVSLPVTFTTLDHYNLVGNPYPSAIDFDQFIGASTRVSHTLAIRDAGSGVFRYWTNTAPGVGSGGIPNGVIAQGQSFWIQTTAASPALPITEAAKVATPASAGDIFYRTMQVDPDMLQITATGSTQTANDIAYVYQLPNAINGKDNWDAVKLDNYIDDPFVQLFDLYTTAADSVTQLAVNALPVIGCNTKLTLGLKDTKVGTYSYTFNKFGNVQKLHLQLKDKFTGQTVDLSDNGVYNFSVTTAPASQAANRFQLTFSEDAANLNLDLDAIANVCDSTAVSNVIVKDAQTGVDYYAMLGASVASDTITGAGSNLSLSVPNSLLKMGINHFVIKAQQVCGQFALNKTVDIFRDSAAVTKAIAAQHCQEGSVTLTATGAPLDGSYAWYESETGDAIPGKVASTFSTPSLVKTKTYYVAAVNSNGCEGSKVAVKATIVNYADPVIQEIGSDTLLSNFAYGNHWYLDDAVLADTSAMITAHTSGNYKLSVATSGCQASVERTVTISVTTGVDSPFATHAYPNPFANVIALEVNADNTANSAFVSNTLGLPIGTISLTPQGNVKRGEFDFTGLPSGMYYIQVGDSVTGKVIKVIKK